MSDLEPFLQLRWYVVRRRADQFQAGLPAVFERVTGIDRGQYHRCVREGGFTLAMADRIADSMGYHPAEIWGQAWWQASEMEEVA